MEDGHDSDCETLRCHLDEEKINRNNECACFNVEGDVCLSHVTYLSCPIKGRGVDRLPRCIIHYKTLCSIKKWDSRFSACLNRQLVANSLDVNTLTFAKIKDVLGISEYQMVQFQHCSQVGKKHLLVNAAKQNKQTRIPGEGMRRVTRSYSSIPVYNSDYDSDSDSDYSPSGRRRDMEVISVSSSSSPDGRELDGQEPDGREPDGREPDGRELDGRELDDSYSDDDSFIVSDDDSFIVSDDSSD